MMTWTRWWLWRWRRGGRARGITTGSSNKDTVGEMGVTGVRLWARPVPATLSPAAGPGRAMKVLLLAGLGALFFAYYWDDNFDPGQLRADGPLRARRAGLPGAEPPRRRPSRHAGPQRPGDTLAHAGAPPIRSPGSALPPDSTLSPFPSRTLPLPAPNPNFPGSRLRPLDLGSAPGWCSPSSIRNSAPVLEPRPYIPRPRPQALGSAPAPSGLLFLLRPVTRSRHLQVNFLSYVQLTSLALPSLTDSKGSLVVVSSLLGRVPTSFSSPYSAAKFALNSFFGSLRRELDVQDVNVAITMCVLGLRDRASAAEGVRGVTRAKAAPGPKAALAVIRGSATRASGVFYPWRFHLLCLLRGWMPQPRAWFIRQELNITTPAAS
eukprot:bmy_06937T0